jgi:GTPase SAR1 family protein
MVSASKMDFMKIVLLGEMNVGKTTLINTYCGKAGATGPTVGTGDFQKKEIMVGDTKMSL